MKLPGYVEYGIIFCPLDRKQRTRLRNLDLEGLGGVVLASWVFRWALNCLESSGSRRGVSPALCFHQPCVSLKG